MEKVAIRRLGAGDAKKLAARLRQVDAADSFAEVKLGNPEEKAGGLLTLHIGMKNRLVLKPGAMAVRNSSGQLLWESVTDATVVLVGDYHGQDLRRYNS